MTEELEKKIAQAIRLLKATAPKDGSPVEVAYSGGKDSDVILQLVKESGIPYRAIYKNTTIDPPGTIKHVREMGVEIAPPRNGLSFFALIRKKGAPSRNYRFCCQELKEYHVDNSMHTTIIGVRKSESTKRAARYTEPTACIGTKNDPNEAVYPLLEWTDADVLEFLLNRKVKCAPIYYDEDGTFHVERRLGCMCCPLTYRKKRVKEFQQWPRMLNAYLRNLRAYMQDHPESNTCQLFNDEYEWMYKELFCDTKQQFLEQKNGLFGKPDFKAFLEEYFKVNLEN